ncbi:MAG: sensor domain-containing diguanylate cyclase [Candidatus Omnitrophica bacterium]|nr:sensor domain-containing diguanylate cyclase [Candidatus Omnitrophota bacterium]MDD5310532.1 sensor domain-containing diguanylate cyclase [Candidatus Omnitrophota bacterium]MDD5546042.1 sensor domain-containing diguanylate cyclase [Candidatus Omnitrophota bacterium]
MPRLNISPKRWGLSKRGVLPVFFILALIPPLYCIGRPAHIYIFTLNFSLIAVIAAAFEFGLAVSYMITGCVTAFTLVLMLFNRGFELPYFASIVFLNTVPLIPSYFNNKYAGYFASKNSSLSDGKKSFDEFTAELKSLKDLNASLQNQVHDILDLYEVTKKMSASLDTGDMLRIFREAISKISRFVTARVILLEESHKRSTARVTYEIHNPSTGKLSSGEIRSGPPDKFDHLLAEMVSAGKEIISLKAPIDKGHPFAPYLGDAGRSFIALPLLSEGEPLGILAIRGIDEEHAESFSILAKQLALELKKANLYEKVQELAITDGLTGIYVRRHFIERLNEEVARSKRHNLKLSLLMIDLDHFKQCNDTYGHLVGDIVLKEISRIMKEYVRQVDLIGRYGGEEFVIALPDTDKNSALNVADRIRMSVEKHKFRAYDETISMTISIGVATFPETGEDVATLIDRADQALYKAKEAGRNKALLWP